MTTDLELNDLKRTWQALDLRLSRDYELRLDDLRERRLATVRATLRPLLWSHIALVTFGVLLILIGVGAWNAGRPGDAVFVSGVIMHVYGVITIIGAASFASMIARLDYAAPVVSIQSQMLRLRRAYQTMKWCLDVPWTVLWLPLFISVTRMHAPAPLWVGLNIGIAFAILGVVVFFTQRAQRRATTPDDACRLNRVRAQLDDLARFERED
jgi:hypothetical protein